jgi:putative ABC transport system permease protein
VLVTAEFTLALVLLAGAGLMIRSLAGLRAVDLGFDPDHVVVASISVSSSDEANTAILERLAALPDVEAAGGATNPPFGGSVNTTPISVQGDRASSSTVRDAGVHYVGGAFFGALRTPILHGRLFAGSDNSHAPRVAILNHTAAARLFPHAEPLGQRIHLDVNWVAGVWAEVVGVVGDVKYGKVEDAVDPDVYLPFQQDGFLMSLFVRSPLPAETVIAAIRREVRAIDPKLPLSSVRTLRAASADAIARAQYSSWLLTGFAGLATLLCAVGVYGVVSYVASARRREIGTRLALGARRRDIMRLVLAQGVPLVAAGLVAGLASSLLVTRVLRNSLYLVSPMDRPTLTIGTLFLAAVGILACYVPAVRALRVDPITALRE